MTSEERAQKFHADAASLPISYLDMGSASDEWKFASANQMRYPDLGRDESSIWNFCCRCSDAIFFFRGKRGRGTSGGGGVQNVGCFAQANYFTISLTYYFILQQCLIWLHQYVSQIYFDQLYEISFSKVHHVDFPLLLKGKIERHETAVFLKKTHIAIKPRSYTC